MTDEFYWVYLHSIDLMFPSEAKDDPRHPADPLPSTNLH